MLQLHIKSIDPQQQPRNFIGQLTNLETALNTLSLIASAGSTILSVYILEEGHRTSLPPQAFDQCDDLKPIRALQMEWEALLKQPLLQQISPDRLLQCEKVLDHIDQLETRMADYDTTITRFNKLVIRDQERLREGQQKEWILAHYQAIIDRQQLFIERAQVGRDEWLDKLSRLKQVERM